MNLESLVLPLKESQELAEKGIFKARETVFAWYPDARGNAEVEIAEWEDYYPDGDPIPAPTLREMLDKIREISTCSLECPGVYRVRQSYFVKAFDGAKLITGEAETAELAAAQLLMEVEKT